jgi:nicotinate phosphoribosyltransferase
MKGTVMIINSMLDNDLYKFTMMQAVLHQFPAVEVEYKFKCRTEGVNFAPHVFQIIDAVDAMCSELSFTQDELGYLSGLRFIKSDFVQFLKLFKFERDYVHVGLGANGELDIRVKGPWLHTILFEVPILAIVSEVYSTDRTKNYKDAVARLLGKVELVRKEAGWQDPTFRFADFGTRRRHCVEWHDEVVRTLSKELPHNLVGTSNVLLAKKYGLTPIGTMAHEWIQAHQALYRVADSQFKAFENWAKEYRGDLGIALSDTVGLKAFLCDFDMFFTKLFDGTRQDSGNPYHYAEEMIKHYESMHIDPRTKTIVFSDGQTIESAIELWDKYMDKIGISFGIGTHLTNDFDYKALQIVIKMIKCNEQPVAKLSDSPGKYMCEDEDYTAYLRSAFNRREAECKPVHG